MAEVPIARYSAAGRGLWVTDFSWPVIRVLLGQRSADRGVTVYQVEAHDGGGWRCSLVGAARRRPGSPPSPPTAMMGE